VPWVTDTTWVTNDVVESMAKKTYTTETLFDELFGEIKDLTGNTAFIENHRAHLHPATVGITGGLGFSDTSYDYSTTFPILAAPPPKRSKDPIDLRDDVMVVVPKASYTATDATAIARYDAGGLKHQSLVVLSTGTLADATTKANALLAAGKAERITYEFDVGPLTAAQLASIPVGCLVPVTSAVLGLSASTQRIAAMTVTYRHPDQYMVHVEAGFPVRQRVNPIRIAPLATYESSFARIEDPFQDHDPATPPNFTILNFVYTSEVGHTGFPTPAPKSGLMDYDQTGAIDAFHWTGLKMLGRGTITELFCQVPWQFAYTFGSPAGGGMTLDVLKNGIVVATASLADSGSGLHSFNGTLTIDDTSGIAVANGDIITARLSWLIAPAIGAIPGSGVGSPAWMFAQGSLTDDVGIIDGVLEDLATSSTDPTLVMSPDGSGGVVMTTVKALQGVPFSGLPSDGQFPYYDATTGRIDWVTLLGLFGTVLSPTQLAANTDNWNPTGLATACVIRADLSADWNLTGIVPPAATGQRTFVLLANVSTHTLTLKHDTTSTAANRFYCPGDLDVPLAKDTAVLLWYDLTTLRWRLAGGSGSSSSAGGLPWFNVKTYGAVGDGTTDDTTAVNVAIAALVAAGRGVLYFPAGTYKITAALTSLSVPCTVLGDGIEVSKIVCTSTTAVLFTGAASGCTFRDLWLHNSATATAGAALRVTTGHLNRYINLFITSFWIGLDIQAGIGWVATGCYIESVKKYGIKVSGSDADWNITDTLISDAAASSADAAVRIESTGDGGGGKISGLKVNGTAATGYNYGIDLAVQATTATVDLQISNCSIENTRNESIHGTTTGGGKYGSIIITGNEFGFNAAGHSISLVAASLGDFYDVIIGPNVYDGPSATSAIQLTNVIGDVHAGVIHGSITSLLTTTTSTVRDFTRGLNAGTSFPGSPATSDLFFRTDRDLIYYYDGTRWLTVTEYNVHLVIVDALMGATTAPVVAGPIDQGANGCYATRLVAWTITGGTTSTNYVVYTLSSAVANNTLTTVGSTFSTQSDTNGNTVAHNQTIGAVVDASGLRWRLAGVKTLSPTGLYCDAILFYRLIG